jgi:hypothetical protein
MNNTNENNKLILEFMGYPNVANDEDKKDYLEDCVKYHSSWDWLIPVIDKCYQEHMSKHIVYAVMTCNKNKAYQAVIKFIKEYNQNK